VQVAARKLQRHSTTRFKQLQLLYELNAKPTTRLKQQSDAQFVLYKAE